VKLKVLVITLLFAAGVVASVAIAKGPPEGKGKNTTGSTGTATGTTTDKHGDKKMWICHKTGNGKWVKIQISKKAWPAHQAHGDHELVASTGTTSTSTGTTSTGKGKKKGKNKAPAGSCAAGGGGGTTSTATTATTS
jgi:hypothetical protein